jgi:hypothetical protein
VDSDRGDIPDTPEPKRETVSGRSGWLIVALVVLAAVDVVVGLVGIALGSISNLPTQLVAIFGSAIQVLIPAMILRRQPERRLRRDWLLLGFLVLSVIEVVESGASVAINAAFRSPGGAADAYRWAVALGLAFTLIRSAGAILVAVGLARSTRRAGAPRSSTAGMVVGTVLGILAIVDAAMAVRLTGRLGPAALFTGLATSPVVVTAWAVAAWLAVRAPAGFGPRARTAFAAGATIEVVASVVGAIVVSIVYTDTSVASVGLYESLAPVIALASTLGWGLILVAADRGLPRPGFADGEPPPPPPPPPRAEDLGAAVD